MRRSCHKSAINPAAFGTSTRLCRTLSVHSGTANRLALAVYADVNRQLLHGATRALVRLFRFPGRPGARLTLLLEDGGPPIGALLAGRLLDPGGNCPDMPLRVHDPPGPIAPELVFCLDEHLGACRNCALDRGVDVLDVDEDH